MARTRRCRSRAYAARFTARSWKDARSWHVGRLVLPTYGHQRFRGRRWLQHDSQRRPEPATFAYYPYGKVASRTGITVTRFQFVAVVEVLMVINGLIWGICLYLMATWFNGAVRRKR